jgi:tetratricopeptide (TPR) repeat protein
MSAGSGRRFFCRARRFASDFEGAHRAFNEAWRILEEEGTNDLLDRAHVIGLESGYMQDMGEFEIAEASLEEALEIYRQLRDAHLEGRTLLKMGDCIGQIYPERGIARVRQALPLIDAAKEPRLELCAQHDLAWFLNDSGKPEEALVVLDRARRVYQQFPDKWTQLRLHWLEGRIAASIGAAASSARVSPRGGGARTGRTGGRRRIRVSRAGGAARSPPGRSSGGGGFRGILHPPPRGQGRSGEWGLG